jgi:hypothetical protein
MLKWRLMMTTLPYVIAAIVAKILLVRVFDLPGWLQLSEVTPILTAGAFLIGFMLSGTMSDYKESEKLPAELAMTLETLEDVVTVVANRKDLDGNGMRARLYEISQAIAAWLGHSQPVESVYAALTRFTAVVEGVDAAGGGSFAVRLTTEMHNLRRSVTRIEVISKTGFLPSGYALLDVLVLAVVGLLLSVHYVSEVDQTLLIGLLSSVYIYMVRLIRDIDDPFEYTAELGRTGSAEVELFPFLDYLKRARERISQGSPVPRNGTLATAGEGSQQVGAEALGTQTAQAADAGSGGFSVTGGDL